MDETQMRAELKRLADKTGRAKDYATRIGISQSYLSDAINGRRDLSDNLLARLGYERVTTYRKVKK